MLSRVAARAGRAGLRRGGVRASSTAVREAREGAGLGGEEKWVQDHYELVSEEELPELSAFGRLWRHRESAAEVLSMHASTAAGGDEKVFGIAFPTLPEDSTGVAHILEHSVLSGSHRYPGKEPFADLMRGSMQTFLNAMTYPDRTVYPVASCNVQDYWNLMDVYVDSVLRPKLGPDVFRQEGWRFDAEAGEAGAGLDVNGVVLSEMQGVHSSPDSLHSMACHEALFPGHPYGVCSGGDPTWIPALKLQDFEAFHRKWYSPSRARVFFWGDAGIPEAERLRRLHDSLVLATAFQSGASAPLERVSEEARQREAQAERARAAVSATLPSLAPGDYPVEWHPTAGANPYGYDRPTVQVPASGVPPPAPDASLLPPRVYTRYPAEGEGGEAGMGHFVTVQWALPDAGLRPGDEGYMDDADRIGVTLLASLLLERRTAPLQQALLESRLGTALTGGLTTHLRQSTFGAGLQGVFADGDVEDTVGRDRAVAEVEGLVQSVLERQAQDGFAREEVEAELHSLELRLRALEQGGTPKGLTVFLSVAGPWLYGRDVFASARYEAPLAELRRRALEAPDAASYFPGLLRRLLLDNAHRTTVVTSPDPALSTQLADWEASALAEVAAAVDAAPGLRTRLAADADAMGVRQNTGDPEEAAAMIPYVQLSDLPRSGAEVPTVVEEGVAAGGGVTLSHPLPSNGLVHVGLALDAAGLGPQDVVLAGLLAGAVGDVPPEGMTRGDFSRALALRTSGVDATVRASGNGSVSYALCSVSTTCLARNQGEAADLLRRAVEEPAWDSAADALETLVAETVSGHQASLQSHRVPLRALAPRYSAVGGWTDAAHGLRELALATALRGLLKGSKPEGASGVDECAAVWGRLAGGDPADMANAARSSPGAVWDVVQSRLAGLHSSLMGQGRLLSVTTDADDLPSALSTWSGLHESLATRSASPAATSMFPGISPLPWRGQATDAPRADDAGWHSTAIVAPSLVQHTAMAGAVPDYDRRRTRVGAWHVVSSLISSQYLWEHVRVRGNAYGAVAAFDHWSGVFQFGSYRDPRLGGTLDDIQNVPRWLRSIRGSAAGRDWLHAAIRSNIASMDAPTPPGAKASLQSTRYLLGVTADDIQQRREEMLSTSDQDLADVADAIEAALHPSARPSRAAILPASLLDDWHAWAPASHSTVLRPIDEPLKL